MGLMSVLLFLPVIGALVVLFLPKDRVYQEDRNGKVLKVIGFVFSFLVFLLSIPLFVYVGSHYPGTNIFEWFNTNVLIVTDGGQRIAGFSEVVPWLNLGFVDVNASYHLQVDAISILMIVLTTLLIPITILASWRSISFRIKEFIVCMLLMEAGMLGAFMAWDLLLFYVFWEVMLIPMYFIIGIWGGESKVYAAVKFFIYTLVGSLLMFLGIIYIYLEVGTFNLSTIYEQSYTLNIIYDVLGYGISVESILFLAFFLSFAIKVPIFPFHTWLPDAHVQAPTAGSVVLAGVLLKMGTYGFIRFAIPFFPNASFSFAPYISILAIVGIIYGALMALAQKDIKKLIAYSSVSHLGFVMLGLFAFSSGLDGKMFLSYQGVSGAIYQMINHGLSTGLLFLLVGVLYERRHTKDIEAFGGLSSVMPIYAVVFMITTLSSIGLPGLNGFIGEFLILIGSFRANWVYGTLGAFGIILSAVYMLYLYQKVFFGECVGKENKALKDLTKRELSIFVPLIILVILMGVYPNLFLDKIELSLNTIFSAMPQINKINWLY